jgi:hypothetical protein
MVLFFQDPKQAANRARTWKKFWQAHVFFASKKKPIFLKATGVICASPYLYI